MLVRKGQTAFHCFKNPNDSLQGKSAIQFNSPVYSDKLVAYKNTQLNKSTVQYSIPIMSLTHQALFAV